MDGTPTTEGPAAKKRRASTEPTAELVADIDALRPPLQRSTKFWLADGNLILRAQELLFRVHHSILSIHSTVFADMFAMPQPESPSQCTLDGCPVVEVTDSDVDWTEMLTVLYNTSPIYYAGSNITPVDTMLAMLRLGHKYNFERFKNEALQQLKDMYPRSLEDVDLILGGEPDANSRTDLLRRAPSGHEFKILHGILELRINTILPMAYFFCIRRRPLADILSRRDETEEYQYLSIESVNTLVLGKEKILMNYAIHNFSWFRTTKFPLGCLSESSCKKRMSFVRARLLATINLSMTRIFDPPGYLVLDGLCEECEDKAMAAYNRSRRELLDILPSLFDLPAWDELTDF